ncbi:MAG: hypothetical protein ABJH82_10210 [Polaribacter sp.]|uniref:hypothetical protein n=1 Tax=Polaribacter sp. TaxID=1920175 RepID=UPI003265FF60
MDQNNLDKMFQKQLKNLEVTPSKKVWNNIESKLQHKKRKIIPIWWFVNGGIAALFVLGLFLFPFSNEENDFNKTDSKIIITESSIEKVEVETNIKIDSTISVDNFKKKVIVANKKVNTKQIIKNNSEKKKTLVSTKNAMKKIFLADNSKLEKIDSSKKEQQNVIKKEQIYSDKTTPDKQEDKVNNINKTNIKKVDLNNLKQNKDSVFSNHKEIKKWMVAPVFAVLNSNSFSNSSPVASSLSNSTEGKNSFSYGFQIGYKINDKWTIQSGIHKQEMSYVNNNITVVSSISKNVSSISFNNGSSFSFETASKEKSDFASNSILNTQSLNGNLNQNFGYIEIPLEIKYTFLDTNKFNSQIVTGFSSLFLNKNEVNLRTTFLTKSGKATNLNAINFSGNLGLDFNYSLHKNWSLNLNPMFKVQLNTFYKNDNGFSPFNLGIYSGVKFNF